MEESFIAYLIQAGSPVLSAVSTRVHWGTSPQGEAMPRIVLTRIDGVPVYSDEGESELTESRVQVDCYADTFAAVKTAARAVKTHVSGIETTKSDTAFDAIFIESERDSFEIATGGSKIYRVSMDLMIWHRSI